MCEFIKIAIKDINLNFNFVNDDKDKIFIQQTVPWSTVAQGQEKKQGNVVRPLHVSFLEINLTMC